MKRRSQTKVQVPTEAAKKPKEKAGALTLDQFSSDVIWQVGAPLNKTFMNSMLLQFYCS